MSAADLVGIRSIKVDDNFGSLYYVYPVQFGEVTEIPSIHGNTLLFVYYAWEIQAMILQSNVHSLSTDVFPRANVRCEVTEMAAAPIDGISKNTDTAVLVTKFDVANYRLQDLDHRGNQISDPWVPHCNMGNAHILLFFRSFRVYGFDHASGRLSIPTAAAANDFKAF